MVRERSLLTMEGCGDLMFTVRAQIEKCSQVLSVFINC